MLVSEKEGGEGEVVLTEKPTTNPTGAGKLGYFILFNMNRIVRTRIKYNLK